MSPAAARFRATVEGFRRLVLAALDAGGHGPTSAAARYALDRIEDVGAVVARATDYVVHYRLRSVPANIDPVDAALCLAILAERETARGVRTVGP